MQLFFASKETLGRTAALVAIMLTCLGAALPSAAQQASEVPFGQRYPAASIDSTEAADIVLDAASKEHAKLDYDYIDDQRACYSKFFVSYCLDNAKDHHRILSKQVREVEAVANVYKRQTKADERDKSLNEQRIKDEQDAGRRLQDQQSKAAATARQLQDSAVKQQTVNTRESLSVGHENDRVALHDAKIRADDAAEAAKAPQRVANEQAYKEKVKAAEVHRLDVEAKKAAKEKDIAEKKRQSQVVPAPAPDFGK